MGIVYEFWDIVTGLWFIVTELHRLLPILTWPVVFLCLLKMLLVVIYFLKYLWWYLRRSYARHGFLKHSNKLAVILQNTNNDLRELWDRQQTREDERINRMRERMLAYSPEQHIQLLFR